MAMVDRMPSRIQIDGADMRPEVCGQVMLLPRGQHLGNAVREIGSA